MLYDTATTVIYTLSLHDALPICPGQASSALLDGIFLRIGVIEVFPERDREAAQHGQRDTIDRAGILAWQQRRVLVGRSEEHTSELQSQSNLVCRLLLEKKKNKIV